MTYVYPICVYFCVSKAIKDAQPFQLFSYRTIPPKLKGNIDNGRQMQGGADQSWLCRLKQSLFYISLFPLAFLSGISASLQKYIASSSTKLIEVIVFNYLNFNFSIIIFIEQKGLHNQWAKRSLGPRPKPYLLLLINLSL